MFCPNCGTQNPETATTCTKCGFALKSGAGAGGAAPKFKGTMLMQGAPPNMAALRAATAPAAEPAPAGPVSAATGAGNIPPSRLKGTIVGVAAPAAGAAPAPPSATGAGAGAGAPAGGFPGTLAFDAPPPVGGQPPPDQHQFGAAGGANPLGATFALGAESPASPFGSGDLGGAPPGAPPMGGAPPPAFGGPMDGAGAPGGYGAPPAPAPMDQGYGAPPAAPPGGYGAPPGGPIDYGQQPGGGFGGPPAQGGMAMQAPQPMGMNPYAGQGGAAPIMNMGGPGAMMGGPGQKSWLVTLLLAVFAGTLGVHRFYTGHILFGVLQLITCGGGGIWTLIDIIFILTGKYTDAQGRPLVKN